MFRVRSLRTNTTIQILRSLCRLGFLRRRKEARTVDEMGRRLRIRMASVEQPVQSLSGGNQQKVSLTRPFLRGSVKVILAEEPTQGVDVGARFEIYEALREKATEGVAMTRGRIIEEIAGDELGERRIVEAIVGSGLGKISLARGRGCRSRRCRR